MTDKPNPTKSQEVAADVAALLRARTPLLWIVTREEARVERHLVEAAISVKYIPRTWDVAAGVTDMNGEPEVGFPRDPGEALAAIGERIKARESDPQRCVWIMRDLPVWLGGGLSGASTLRQLRNLARLFPTTPLDSAQAVIVLSPDGNVPAELTGHATVIEWPLPDRAEIAAILDAAISGLPDDLRGAAAPNGTRDAAIDAAVGLSGEEAQACYARSLVQLRRIDPATVAKEKKRVIARERVLEWIDPIIGGLDAVGGLDQLKVWLTARKLAYTPKARAYGLPAPKGVFLAGISGCGKSLTAKAVPTAWSVPMLKLDLGALKSKFVGDSEGNLRKALRVIEAIGRCVVWIDEIDKAMQGATSGSADGGVSADALGAILNWMQERQGEAFVIATANDITGLPPELLRKGRFDDLFFIDLPNATEREAVVLAALAAHGRITVDAGTKGEIVDVDIASVAAACDGFTGSEIAAIVPEAMFAAFGDGAREITTADVIKAARSVVPLSKTAGDKIEAMRNLAKGKMRPATSAVVKIEQARSSGRALDL
jgi:AAA+ superfamily predicted ATPase